jgi:hypothetical protein
VANNDCESEMWRIRGWRKYVVGCRQRPPCVGLHAPIAAPKSHGLARRKEPHEAPTGEGTLEGYMFRFQITGRDSR